MRAESCDPTVRLPGDGQVGLLVTVESSDYTIGNAIQRV